LLSLIAKVAAQAQGESVMADIKSIYEEQFLPVRNTEWLSGYAAAVEWACSASEAAFRAPDFQKRLWEIEHV
jgi:hypothetical protein